MPQRNYRPGTRRSDLGKTDAQLSPNRFAWLKSVFGQLVIMVHPTADVEEDFDIKLFYPLPRSKGVYFDLTSMTEPELEAFEKLITTAVEWARPIVKERDKRAQAALDRGDDSFPRVYRPLPQLIFRKGHEPAHWKELRERSLGAPPVDGAGFSTIPMQDFPRLAAKYLNETRDLMSAKTTERRITSFRSFGKYYGIAVLTDYKGPKPARALPHPLPEGMGGVARMAAVANTNEHKALIGLCGYNGLRIGETLTVSFSSFDLQEMMLLVRGKGQRERVIPLATECFALVTPLLIENMNTPNSKIIALAESSARKAITSIGRRAGICRSVASHDLRHTVATALLNKTGNMRLVQEFLGHSSITTTQVYTMVELDNMREAMDSL